MDSLPRVGARRQAFLGNDRRWSLFLVLEVDTGLGDLDEVVAGAPAAPPGLRTRRPCAMRSVMSRRAVSWEHLESFAHFDVVRLPSNSPSNRRFMTRRWRSLRGTCAACSQNRALPRTPDRDSWAPSMARPRQSRNQPIHAETSIVPFCVRSRMS